MARLTIRLSDRRQRALKEAAARWGKTMGEVVEESLVQYGIRSREETVDLVRRVREQSGLEEPEALALGVKVTREVRKGAKHRAPA